MITSNSLSGGKTSLYMGLHYTTDINIFACVCIDEPKCEPKDKSVLNYCLEKLNGNFIASAEHDKTLKVMMQYEQLLGKEVVWVRGKSFDQIIDEAGRLPTWARRFCTTEMKIKPMFEYLYFRYGVVMQNIGFRFDEQDRSFYFEKDAEGKRTGKKIIINEGYMSYPVSCGNFGAHQQNWDYNILWQYKKYPLIEDIIFHHKIVNFWNDLHPEFIFPPDSNCLGCHHKPEWLIKKNYEDSPEHLIWFAKQEKKKELYGNKFHTFSDSGITYEEIFKKDYPTLFDGDYTMCNSGGCTN